MVERGVRASIKTHAMLLQGCIRMNALAEGKRVHAHIVKNGYASNIFLGNTVVNMYAKCGSLLNARQVFDMMAIHNVFSWATIISAYAKQGQGQEAVNLFLQMQREGVAPDKFVLVAVLKLCANLADLEQGKQVHLCAVKSGLVSDVSVGNSLVDMYAKCKAIEDAREVFNKMHERDVDSWSVMIAGYTQEQHFEDAISVFGQMQQGGVKPDRVTFVTILKACAGLVSLEMGKQAHAQFIESGFELDVPVANTLIGMYVKCGGIGNARQVFNMMSKRDILSWNVMIAGYSQQGHGEEALALFDQMQWEGWKPNNITLVNILKACTMLAALDRGKQIHAHIIKDDFESNVFVGSTLVDMYVKCGSIEDAHQVFSKIRERNVVSWNVMIAGYVRHGHCEEALALFEQMQWEDVKPNHFTFVSILKACASLAELKQGKQVHSQIIKCGLESNGIVRNTLVDMYAKCGSIENARQLFDGMRERDVVSWTAMISGYVQHGLDVEALKLFEQMQCEGTIPNNVTFVCILKACARLAKLEWGKKIHAHVINGGFESDVFVASTLVDMYAKCGSIEDAWQVFSRMCKRNVVSWNVMIAGYVQQGHTEKALTLFEQMQHEDVRPDKGTIISILKACAGLLALERGRKVHAHAIERGLESDLSVMNTLVDMYAKCGSIEYARQLFDRMQERDKVSWTVMIAGYSQQGNYEAALSLFDQMQWEHVTPNNVTFISILKACAGLAALERGKQVHGHIIKSGYDLDVFVGSALIDMYAKCGSIEDARKVFSRMHERDVVCWNAIIIGCAQLGHAEEALTLFEQMHQGTVKPDTVTFVGVLKACASLAALERGKQVHAHLIKRGFESDVFVGSALVDMYAKCGSIKDAHKVFTKLVERNVVLWTAMIAAYAHQGHGEEALSLFEQMQQEGVKPDDITFLSILSACRHAGLVDKGLCCFYSMIQDHGISPTMEHYACMVDLLGRAGHLYEAEDFIDKMPIQPNTMVWMALLGACRSSGNVELGMRAFESVLKLEPHRSGAYVLLSHILAAAGRWDEVAKIRKKMEDAGVHCEQRAWMKLD